MWKSTASCPRATSRLPRRTSTRWATAAWARSTSTISASTSPSASLLICASACSYSRRIAATSATTLLLSTGPTATIATKTGCAGKFAYQFIVGTLPLNSDSALAGALAATAMSSGPTYNYGLEWQPPVDGLRLAVTGLSTEWKTTFGNPAAPTHLSINPFVRQIYSVEYVRDKLTLNAEYGLENLDFDWGFGGPVEKRRGDSWYVGSAYRFTDWMELGAYYNEYYQDRNHRDGSNHAAYGMPNDFNMYQKDAAVTLRLDPMRNVVVKFEGHALQGTALNWLNFAPASMVKDWTLFAAKVTYNF